MKMELYYDYKSEDGYIHGFQEVNEQEGASQHESAMSGQRDVGGYSAGLVAKCLSTEGHLKVACVSVWLQRAVHAGMSHNRGGMRSLRAGDFDVLYQMRRSNL